MPYEVIFLVVVNVVYHLDDVGTLYHAYQELDAQRIQIIHDLDVLEPAVHQQQSDTQSVPTHVVDQTPHEIVQRLAAGHRVASQGGRYGAAHRLGRYKALGVGRCLLPAGPYEVVHVRILVVAWLLFAVYRNRQIPRQQAVPSEMSHRRVHCVVSDLEHVVVAA